MTRTGHPAAKWCLLLLLLLLLSSSCSRRNWVGLLLLPCHRSRSVHNMCGLRGLPCRRLVHVLQLGPDGGMLHLLLMLSLNILAFATPAMPTAVPFSVFLVVAGRPLLSLLLRLLLWRMHRRWWWGRRQHSLGAAARGTSGIPRLLLPPNAFQGRTEECRGLPIAAPIIMAAGTPFPVSPAALLAVLQVTVFAHPLL